MMAKGSERREGDSRACISGGSTLCNAKSMRTYIATLLCKDPFQQLLWTETALRSWYSGDAQGLKCPEVTKEGLGA